MAKPVINKKAPTDPLLADLRDMIGRRQVVVVVGSGVSLATNRQSPTWRGLIEAGLQHCRAIGVPKDWCDGTEQLLRLAHADMLLSAAELVHEKLSQNGGGELARWLRDTFEPLQPDNPSAIQTLAALKLPLLTTNYDDLIEKATSFNHVTWQDTRHVSRVIRGDDRRVLHLHGHWDKPDSIVLGIRSYEAVKHSEHNQAVMRALAMTNSLLLVGCGEEGLGDPNFGNFLSRLEAVETGAVAAGFHHDDDRLATKNTRMHENQPVFLFVSSCAFRGYPCFVIRYFLT